MLLHILNGPNLNLVGRREPEVYGKVGLEKYLSQLAREFETRATLSVFQSNHEGALLDKLHEVGFRESGTDGIVLNAGALGHTSLALGDAIRGIEVPVVDVHISNVHAREGFRQHSYVTPACVGSISGLGLEGYRLAVEYFLRQQTA